ncbi:1-aminocyclopropane-1-carboxylate deaminase [Leptospira sp. WS60.C2]
MPCFIFGTKDSYPNLPVRITNLPGYSIIRDDLLPLGFGTKWRKVWGLVSQVPKSAQNGPKNVLLWGAIHGNYLASFSFILRRSGFSVETIAYTKDPILRTYNERLVRAHSQSIHCYANRTLAYEAFTKKKENFEGLCLPEFGIHPSAEMGLHLFWKELKSQMPKKAILLLEIGSGLSFLSAYDFFWGSQIQVRGLMVGESKTSWLSKRENLQKELGLLPRPIPEDWIWDENMQDTNVSLTKPQTMSMSSHPPERQSKRFGNGFQKNKPWIQNYYEKTKILLEPVYSAGSLRFVLGEEFPFDQDPKGLSTMHPMSAPKKSNEMNLFLSKGKVPLFYLHQGGHVQHLDLVCLNPQR